MAAKYEQLKLDNQLCFPLYAASRKIVSKYTPVLKPLGITYTQYLVFLVLWEQDGIKVGDLCRRLYLDNGTVTPLLKKMEAAGYVTRTREDEDERIVTVRLTDAGRDLQEKAADVPFCVGSCITNSGTGAAVPTEEEMKQLYTLLYKFIDVL